VTDVLHFRFATAAAAGVFAATAALATPPCDPVRTGRVCRGALVRRVLLTGELEELRGESISVPRTPSWQVQVRWMAEDGSRVRAGDVVLELDSSAFAVDLEERRLARQRAEEELERQRATAEATRERQQFVVEERRVALEKARIAAAVPADVLPLREQQERELALRRAEVEHAKAVTELEAATAAAAADLEVRRIELAKAARAVDTAARAIEALAVRAPVEGVLVVAEHPWEGRKVQVGDTVWVGMTVMRIPDLDAMQVVAQLADVDDGAVQAGMPATCTLDMYPETRFTGRVVEVGAVAQEPARFSVRRAFRVRVALDAADPERMRPGMSVRVEVTAERREGVLLVPRSALDLGGATPRLRVAERAAVTVELGACTALVCEVVAGAAEGTALAGGSEP